MKLSVITINRNNLTGLRRTVESVIGQTCANYEYIVIDGASTDGSAEYVQEHAHKFAYCVSEPDAGIYNAMNKGICKATGDYLLFINSGDYLVDTDVLAHVISEKCSADILCARCRVSDAGKVVWTSNPSHYITLGELYGVGLAHQSTFIRRELFDRLGLYDESFRYNADIEFWYRAIILGGASTQRIDVVTTDYNLDGISSTEAHTKAYHDEMERIFLHPVLQRIIPDYKKHRKEYNEMEVLRWVKSKKWLYKSICWVYKMAVLFKRKLQRASIRISK